MRSKVGLERRADADVGQPGYGFDRSVADALAEALCRTALRALGERGDALASLVPARFELAPDGVQVEIGHTVNLPGRAGAHPA